MKSFSLFVFALFLSAPATVEARPRESVGMCELKAKSRYAREMEEIAKERNPEMLKALTQDALVRKLDRIDACQNKQIVKKELENQEKKPSEWKKGEKSRQPAKDDWSCVDDVECQNGKIEAMGQGAE
jgi:hypothetical protein